MNAKQLAALATGALLLGVGAHQRLQLAPSAPASAVDCLMMLILLALLVAFVSEKLWAPVTAWLVTIFVQDASFLIRPPMPGFLIDMYTMLGFMAAILYLSVSSAHLGELGASFRTLLDSPNLRLYRGALLLLIPLWAAAVTYARTGSETPAPVYPRSVHPAPPDQSDFLGKSYALATVENPYRRLEKEDPEKFKEAVAEGKKVYYQNCFYCHGDHLDGLGPAAPALNPRPANFQDPGTIAMLQESFVFWRIAKGGPGLPASGHPWNSAMPQWEKILTEDEAWKTILWLYSYTNQSPRTWAPLEH